MFFHRKISYLAISLFLFVYNASIGLSQVVYPVWVNDGLKQVNDSYLSNRYPETEYFVYASTWAFNNESDYPIAVNELREKLQKNLVAKIITDVKSTFVEHYESDNNSESQMTKVDVSISSGASLISVDVETWPLIYEKKVKKVYGYAAVSKAELKKHYGSKIPADLNRIQSKLDGIKENYEVAQKNLILKDVDEMYETAQLDINLLRAIDPTLQGKSNEIEAIRYVIDSSLLALKNEIMQEESYIEQRNHARDLFKKNQCKEALDIYEDLLDNEFGGAELSANRNDAYICYKREIRALYDSHIAKESFTMAVDVCEGFLPIASASDKLEYMNLRDDAIRSYYDKNLGLVEIYLESDPVEAELLLDNIKTFGDGRYDQEIENLRLLVSTKLFEIRENELKSYVGTSDFKEAFLTLHYMRTKNIYNPQKQKEADDLQKMLNAKAFEFEKRKFQAMKPNNWCVKVGYQVYSKPVQTSLHKTSNLQEVLAEQTQSIYSSFSVAVYKKFGIILKPIKSRREQLVEDGKRVRDRSWTDLFGLKYEFIAPTPIDLSDDSLTTLPFNSRLSFDCMVGKFFNIGLGAAFTADNSVLKSNLISPSLGVTFPFWRFNLTGQVHYFSDFKDVSLWNFSGGLLLNINFGKGFNNNDRNTVQSRVNQLKRF